MKDQLIMGLLPVPPEYPSYQPYIASETHWWGVVRVDGDCDIPGVTVLVSIETNGENTWGQMLDAITPKQRAMIESVATEMRLIVTFAYLSPEKEVVNVRDSY